MPGPCSCLERGCDLKVRGQEGDLETWGAPSLVKALCLSRFHEESGGCCPRERKGPVEEGIKETQAGSKRNVIRNRKGRQH